MIKTFLFDLDGTLLDSLDQHEEAFLMACKEFHITIPENIKQEIAEKTALQKIQILFKYKLLNNSFQIGWLLEKKHEFALDLCFKNFKPSLQQIDIMNYIHNHLNCRIAVCSNSPRKFVSTFVHRSGFENVVSFSLSGDDVQFKKPAPDIYLKACKLLSINPDEALVFEDSEEGQKAAKDAGCHVIPIDDPSQISLTFIQNLVKHFGIRYYSSKFVVHK